MSDYNVFVILTPDKANAITTFDLLHNAKCFYKGVGSVAKEPTIDSQEPTPDILTTENQTVVACIVLTFDKEVKDPENM